LPQNALEQCGHSPTILSAAEGHCVGLAVISGLASVEGVEPDSSGLGMEGMLYTIRYWHRFLGALGLALTMGVVGRMHGCRSELGRVMKIGRRKERAAGDG